MNVVYPMVITLAVQTVLAYQMVITWKMNVAHVMLSAVTTAYRIVLVPGVAA